MNQAQNPISNPGTSRTNSSGRDTSLAEHTSKVVDDVRELGSAAMASASDALGAAKQKGSEAVDHARERGQQLMEKGRAGVERSRDQMMECVAENPFKSVLIAAGVGALIGYVIRGRE